MNSLIKIGFWLFGIAIVLIAITYFLGIYYPHLREGLVVIGFPGFVLLGLAVIIFLIAILINIANRVKVWWKK